MKKFSLIFLIMTLLLGLVLRLYRLNAPLADWHSWRQADTASVAREYTKRGINLLRPTYHDLSSIPSGLDNPEGYRFVEFPLLSALHAKLALAYPELGIVAWGRLLSIIASTLTILVIYLIMREVSTPLAASVAAFVYATLPYNLFYGRAILPEPTLVLFMLLSLYSFLRYYATGRLLPLLAYFASLTLALLFKPTALVIFVPIGLYAIFGTTRNWKRLLVVVLLSALSLLPYGLWRQYLANFPAGVPANSWLFNGNGIRFKGSWLRWLFGDRLSRLILGYWGMIPLGFGFLSLGKNRGETTLVGGLVLGSLLYLSVIATGNVQHDYYQIQIIPSLVMLIGVGVSYVYSLEKTLFSKITLTLFLSLCYVITLALGWYEVRGYFNINNPAIVQAGAKLDQLAPPDALVIAPYQGDTAFLFATNRRGWPIGGDIEFKIKAGATYYVTTTREAEYQELIKKYTLVDETDQYSIIKLLK